MNLQGGSQSGFREGSALARFSARRWIDMLQQLKHEFENQTNEIKGYRTLAEEFQAKVETQMKEMTSMQQAVADLQNKLLFVKDQYESEVMRMREKLMSQTGIPPSSSLPLGGHEQQELSSNRQNLPAPSLGFPMSHGSIGDRNLGEPTLKKLRVDGLGGPAGLGPSTKPNVGATALGGVGEGGGLGSTGSLPRVAGMQQSQQRGIGGPLKDKPGGDGAGFVSETSQKNAQAAQQENDYEVVQGKSSNGNLLNMNVKLQNSFAHDSVVCCVRYSWDGHYLATGSNKSAQIFDASSGKLVARFLREEGEDGESATAESMNDSYIRAVCFSPDGNSLITGSEDRLVRIWDIRKRNVRLRLSGHETDIYAVEASSDGKFIVSGSGDKMAKIWDLQSGKLLHTLGGGALAPTDGITSVSISGNGSNVAAGSLDNIVRVWDVETGRLLRSFQGHTDSVYSVAFSPDSRTLLSGSLDKTLKLWDLAANSPSNQCRLSFVGHRDFVLSVAFDPNGRLLLSGSKDHSVQFWDPRIPSMCLMLQGHKNSVISIAHSPTSKMFATGSGDSRARTWVYTN